MNKDEFRIMFHEQETHDDVYFLGEDGHMEGTAFIDHVDGEHLLRLTRCPKCTRGTDQEACLKGVCNWCGFNAREVYQRWISRKTK